MDDSVKRIVEGILTGVIVAIITGGITGTEEWLPIIISFVIGATTMFAVTGWRRHNGAATPTGIDKWPFHRNRSVTGVQLIEMVSGQLGSDRVNTVQAVAGRIYPPLTGQEACKIVQGALSSDRVEIIEAIAPSIRGPLTPRELNNLLSGTLGDERTRASIALANKVK